MPQCQGQMTGEYGTRPDAVSWASGRFQQQSRHSHATGHRSTLYAGILTSPDKKRLPDPRPAAASFRPGQKITLRAGSATSIRSRWEHSRQKESA